MNRYERSGPAIRAALAEYAPGDEHRFAAELRSALARASADLDLAGPQAVLSRWHALATMAANPLTADEQAQLARAKGGTSPGSPSATSTAPGPPSNRALHPVRAGMTRHKLIWLQIADQHYRDMTDRQRVEQRGHNMTQPRLDRVLVGSAPGCSHGRTAGCPTSW